MKIYAIKKVSEKSGKQYTALIMEKDGRTFYLTFDKMTIMRILNFTPIQYEDMELNKPYHV